MARHGGGTKLHGNTSTRHHDPLIIRFLVHACVQRYTRLVLPPPARWERRFWRRPQTVRLGRLPLRRPKRRNPRGAAPARCRAENAYPLAGIRDADLWRRCAHHRAQRAALVARHLICPGIGVYRQGSDRAQWPDELIGAVEITLEERTYTERIQRWPLEGTFGAFLFGVATQSALANVHTDWWLCLASSLA